MLASTELHVRSIQCMPACMQHPDPHVQHMAGPGNIARLVSSSGSSRLTHLAAQHPCPYPRFLALCTCDAPHVPAAYTRHSDGCVPSLHLRTCREACRTYFTVMTSQSSGVPARPGSNRHQVLAGTTNLLPAEVSHIEHSCPLCDLQSCGDIQT